MELALLLKFLDESSSAGDKDAHGVTGRVVGTHFNWSGRIGNIDDPQACLPDCDISIPAGYEDGNSILGCEMGPYFLWGGRICNIDDPQAGT